MQAAGWFVALLGVYAAAGAVFGVVFVAFGVQRLVPAAAHAPWGFRLIILPGAAALWPLLLRRWIARRSA